MRTPKTRPKTKHTQPAYPYWRKSAGYFAGFVLALVVFGASIWYARHGIFLEWEYAWFWLVNDLSSRATLAALIFTSLGSVWAAVATIVVAYFLRLYNTSWRLSLSVLTSYGLVLALKEIIGRARPEDLGYQLHLRATEFGFGFPSAHAATATVLALTIMPFLPKWWGWVVVLAWIVGVALTRIYLGVHAPLDVLGGIAIGTGVVCFYRILPTGLNRLVRLK